MKNFIKWEFVVYYFAGKKPEKTKRPKKVEEIREASVITAVID